ncbi:glycerophosphodiester phosphodiesterase [Bacillus sp. JJ1609]|uniref:glycerophosphodiester phosphodiesterase n=1 Tax=Bacillus sp. JJ1609 TaxID=3122977 RepID=UPI003000B201
MKCIFRMAAIALFCFSFLPAESALAKSPSQFGPFKPINISHRGASGHAPEHTFTAYELGTIMEGDYIEIDLQMTKDGELIAMHDETLDRTTEETGMIKDFTLAQIKRLDAGAWFNETFPQKAKPEYLGLQVPTLREIIERMGPKARYYIETKSPEFYPGMEEKLLDILYEYNLVGEKQPVGKIIIQSFSAESLKKIHQMDESIPLIQLLSYYAPAIIANEEVAKIKAYAVGIGMHYTAISPGYVKKVRDSGLLIYPYTVNEKEDMEMLLDWGVTGMFTNYPDRLNEVIGKRNRMP